MFAARSHQSTMPLSSSALLFQILSPLSFVPINAISLENANFPFNNWYLLSFPPLPATKTPVLPSKLVSIANRSVVAAWHPTPFLLTKAPFLKPERKCPGKCFATFLPVPSPSPTASGAMNHGIVGMACPSTQSTVRPIPFLHQIRFGRPLIPTAALTIQEKDTIHYAKYQRHIMYSVAHRLPARSLPTPHQNATKHRSCSLISRTMASSCLIAGIQATHYS